MIRELRLLAAAWHDAIGDLLKPNDDDTYTGPVGEHPDLPPYVPALNPPSAPAPVPGGTPPAAGGDRLPTSKLLDEAAWSITKLASGRPGNHAALDNLTADLRERAEKFRSVETMTRPLGDVLTDAAAEVKEAAAEGSPGRLPYRVELVNDLRFAATWVARAVPHPFDLSGGASKRGKTADSRQAWPMTLSNLELRP